MSKFVQFIKNNKKAVAIIGGVVVVAGVAIGVLCATSSNDKKEENKPAVETKDDSVDVYKAKETDLEKAKKTIKDKINKDYFAKEDGLKVHSSKDEHSKVLKTLKYNESILVYGKTKDNWYIVDVDGKPGYISNEKDPLSSNNIEQKKKAEEAAKKAQEEAEKQRKAAEQAAAQQQQAQAKQSQSSSNQSSSSSWSSNQSSGSGSSNQQAQQPQQPQQTGYTAGYDAAKTQEFLSAIGSCRSYYGVKSGELDNMLERVYNGSISTSQAQAEIASWRWQEDLFGMGAMTASTNGLSVVKINLPDMSGASFSANSTSYGCVANEYMNLKVYRNSDGTLTVTFISAGFQGC